MMGACVRCGGLVDVDVQHAVFGRVAATVLCVEHSPVASCGHRVFRRRGQLLPCASCDPDGFRCTSEAIKAEPPPAPLTRRDFGWHYWLERDRKLAGEPGRLTITRGPLWGK